MTSKTIIILEDDEPLRNFYCLSLEERGYQMIPANNSAHILELIESYRPVLIITDLVMPDHEGMEGIFTIIAHHKIPIIAISAYERYLKMAKILVAKALLKPISAAELIETVENVLSQTDRQPL